MPPTIDIQRTVAAAFKTALPTPIRTHNIDATVEARLIRFEYRGASFYYTAADGLTNQYWKAIGDFDQAIQMDPTGRRYGWQGNTYFELELFAQSTADWNTACIVDTKSC